MVTEVGSLLFGRALDFAWCHLALSAARLRVALERTSRNDLSFVAEIILAIREDVLIRDVDWLAWEDPFILSREPDELRREREASEVETRKRLAYALPMMELLAQA
jgi:hypothetical protein